MSFSVRTAAEIAPAASELYGPHAAGLGRDELVGRHTGSVHAGFALCELAPGGRIDPHLHSREESFSILEGNPTLVLDGRAHHLAPLDIRDPRLRTFFRLDPGLMELGNRKLGAPVDAPTVSASMATALLAYSGITLKMLVDQRLGAVLHTMFMVQYEPGGVAQPHDHPLEETYYLLDGEVEAMADGETFVLRADDVFWTGVGCIHAFTNRGDRRVRWLETPSPQPPTSHSYRFDRDWDHLASRLPGAGR